MKFLKRSFLGSMALLLSIFTAGAADYGLPSQIQQGNILHCFDWPASVIKANLADIAAAGYGAIQLSPLQRPDTKASGDAWHNLYRPYDIAFKSSSFCSEQDLRDLCTAAHSYGIKVIVDVVANHVDKTSAYHDSWWESNGRVRFWGYQGDINYGSRESITKGSLGDYGEINSENADVIARAKAYVQALKNMGVDGIRWDAAKHIGLPSEGCNFWKEVTSVSGMWHYGEILDAPGPDDRIINEYATYMAVTDNRYSNSAARNNGGLPYSYGGDWAAKNLGNKCVYWGESHDTYSNDEWSQNVDQSVIDRAYAAMACRNDATCLYFARPNTKGFGNIKTGKGTDAFKAKHIAEVNKFRNAMVGRADFFSYDNNAVSITRKDGGAVIVMRGSGNVSISNGGGYCPAGTYTDRVSGATFTVTASTISGNVGSSGIAVIYSDGVTPTPTPDPTPSGDIWILGNLTSGGWGDTPGTGVKMNQDGTTYTATGVEFKLASATETKCYFNLTDYVGSTWNDLNAGANRYGAATEGEAITLGNAAKVTLYAKDVDASGCQSWTIAPGKYDLTFDASAMTLTVKANGTVDPDPTPDPDKGVAAVIPEGQFAIFVKASQTPQLYVWDSTTNANLNGSYPGNKVSTTCTSAAGVNYYYFVVPAGHSSVNCIINFNGDKDKTADLKNITKNTYFEYDGSNSAGKTLTAQSVPSDITIETTERVEPDPEPEPDPITGFVIYYDNSATKFDTVNIHYWDSPSTQWPGTAMTNVSGDIWKYEFTQDPSTLKGFLFCSPSAADGKGQTNDFEKVPVNGHLYKGANSSKGAVTDEGEYNPNVDPEPEPDPITGFVIYYDNSATKFDTVNIHYWDSPSTKWPGTAMTNVSGDIWKYEFTQDPSTLKGFLFCSPSAADGKGQTNDFEKVPVNGHLYKGANSSKGTVTDEGEYNPNVDPEPEPDPITGFVIYYDNSATKFDTVNIHYWDSPSTQWPGTPMTNVSGDIWKYEFTQDPSTLKGFLFCSPSAANGNGQTGNYEKVPVNGHLYKGANSSKGTVTDEGEYKPVDTPVEMPEKLYVMGNLKGHNWDTSYGVEMAKDGDTFVANNVELENGTATEVYFTFVTKLSAEAGDWNTVNSSVRYGANTKDEELVSTASFTEFSSNPGSAYSWKVAKGKYKIIADFKNKTVTLATATGIDSIDADSDVEPVYFNLQGVQVKNPSNGIYIVVRGSKVTKELVK